MSSLSKATSNKSPTFGPLLFVLNYKMRRVLVETPKSYDLLQLSIRRHFPEIPASHRISYHTKHLTACEGTLAEISPDIWETIIPLLKSVTVLSAPTEAELPTIDRRTDLAEQALQVESLLSSNLDRRTNLKYFQELHGHTQHMQAPVSNSPSFDQVHWEIILNIDRGGERFAVQCAHSMTIYDILAGIHSSCKSIGHEFFKLSDYSITWNGSPLSEEVCKQSSIGALGMKNGDIIVSSSKGIRFAKPVIYLLPPAGTELGATLKLSLMPEWHFSAIYPVVPIGSSPSGAETLQWDVRASSNGTLLEKATGLEVAYLFWEAEALAAPSARGTERKSLEADNFVPNQPTLDSATSVVVEVANMTPYLDGALKALGLHIEARTSFITYWLPSFLKHKYIALQFISQSAYERAAPLEVTPAPDLVVRVFMLFKGLKAEEVAPGGEWSEAVDAAKDDVARWRNVVGVDEGRSLSDGSLFRVVEWGGMEVPS